MTHLIRGGIAAGLAAIAAVLIAPTSASADSVRVGLSFGGPAHHHGASAWKRGPKRSPHYVRRSSRHYVRYPHYRPRYSSSVRFVYINPYPVYTPPPPVVYAPAPVQTAAVPQTEGRYCREYQKTVTIGGENQEVYGTACMQPDGAWEIMDQKTVPTDYP